jgi:hypothetical protein
MIHQKPNEEFVSDLLGSPSYCNAAWRPGNSSVTIVSAGGNAEIDIEWRDIPRLASDLLLLYEQARAFYAMVEERVLPGNNIPLHTTQAEKPNLA